MSLRHKKPSTPQALTMTKVLRPRKSRHGRIMVGMAGAGSPDDRNSPYIKRERKVITNPRTGEVEVRHVEFYMSAEEVQAERARVLRASASTIKYGLPNEPEKKK